MATKKKKSKKNVSIIDKYLKEIYGVIWIGISIILMFSLYTNWAGYLSVISKDIFVNLLGVGAFTLPIYMIYVIIKLNFLKEKKILNAKFVGVTIVVITTMLLIQLLDMKSIDTNNFMNAISNIINSQNEITGGIIGFIIVFPIYKLVGSIGLYIIFIIAYFIASVLIFDYSINDLKKLFKLLINNKTNVRNSISKKGRSDSKKIKIKVNNEESEKEEFLKNIESKIKILDFMKNTPKNSIELEEKSEIKINTDCRKNTDVKVQHRKLDDKFKTQKIKKIEENPPIREKRKKHKRKSS